MNAQVRHVTERFGSQYPRRGLGKPVLVALDVCAAFVAVVTIARVAVGSLSPMVEKAHWQELSGIVQTPHES